jgi:hypothetical protein
MTINRLHFYLSVILLSFISSAFADTWLFDFGPANQTTTSNYNNITNPGVHTVNSLVNSEGLATSLSLGISIPFNTTATNSNGTTSPAPETGFLPTATRDSFFGNAVSFQGQTAPNAQLRLTGLDRAQVYDFTLFASRTGVTDNRQTEYKATGSNSKTAFINAAENTSQVALLTDIQPATDGSVVLDLAPGPDNTNSNRFYYLGAMKIVSRVPTCAAEDGSYDDALVKYPFVDGVSPYNMGHWIYRPAGYSYGPCKKYPLLVWLHGAGETCSKASLDSLVIRSSLNSPGYQIQQGTAYTNQRPFLNGLILQPQTCSSWNATDLDALIEYVKTKVRVDEDRIYVTGLSLGGGGTWAYAASKYTKVAAIVPIAGTEQSLSSINAASHVPTWAFHNYNDTNTKGLNPETSLFRCKNYTPRECTIEHIDRMSPFAETGVMFGYSPDHGATMATSDRTANLAKMLPTDLLPTQWNWSNGRLPLDPSAKTILTIFAANGHGGWTTAYSMQDMWLWLYAQKREPAPTIKINSPLVTPANAGVSSGATIVISTKIGLTGVPLGQLTVDLKVLGGSHAAVMNYDSITKIYSLSYSLPAGLTPGVKGIGITAVDTNGNRTVKFLTLTLDP